MRIWPLLLPLALIGCRESYCERLCERVRPQLIEDFAVPEASVNCSDPKFVERDDCASCDQLFVMDFGVSFSPSCSDGGTPFAQPIF